MCVYPETWRTSFPPSRLRGGKLSGQIGKGRPDSRTEFAGAAGALTQAHGAQQTSFRSSLGGLSRAVSRPPRHHVRILLQNTVSVQRQAAPAGTEFWGRWDYQSRPGSTRRMVGRREGWRQGVVPLQLRPCPRGKMMLTTPSLYSLFIERDLVGFMCFLSIIKSFETTCPWWNFHSMAH